MKKKITFKKTTISNLDNVLAGRKIKVILSDFKSCTAPGADCNTLQNTYFYTCFRTCLTYCC